MGVGGTEGAGRLWGRWRWDHAESAVNPRDSGRATPVGEEGSPASSGNAGPAGHPKLCSRKAQPLKS